MLDIFVVINMRVLEVTILILLTYGITVAHPNSNRILKTEKSPSGHMLVQHVVHNEEVQQVQLIDRQNPSKKTVLYECDRGADALFSPNERWIALTDYFFSNASRVLLFRQKQGLKYSQVENLEDKAWKFFAKQQNLTNIDLHHRYMKVVRWSKDSNKVLIQLDGYGDEHFLDPWLFLLDVKSFELRVFPRRANLRAYKEQKQQVHSMAMSNKPL